MTQRHFGHLVTDPTGLTDEAIRVKCPAIFAESKASTASEHFTFVPTSRINEALRAEGFVPTLAAQRKPRDPLTLGSALHMVQYCHRDDLHTHLPERQQIWLINAHQPQGGSSYILYEAVLRLICTNGLVRADTNTILRIPHRGNIVESVVSGTVEISLRAEEIMSQVEWLKSVPFTSEEQYLLARELWLLRFNLTDEGLTREGKRPLFRPEDLLAPVRDEDRSDDAWTVMNRIQWKIFQGGASRFDANNKLRRLRGVNNITDTVNLNRALWRSTVALAKAH